MEKLILQLPSMYGDHHVIEVQRILLGLPGVEDVHASSAFYAVEVTYDPTQVDPSTIQTTLSDAGYVDDPAIPAEIAVPANSESTMKPFFRHTTAYEQTNAIVGFAQTVTYSGRPLWPCPGLGVIKAELYEEDVGNG
jgi:copper chaperone CopZ